MSKTVYLCLNSIQNQWIDENIELLQGEHNKPSVGLALWNLEQRSPGFCPTWADINRWFFLTAKFVVICHEAVPE